MNAIITGASRGVGYELVKELCERGVDTIIAISRNEEKLKKLESDCMNLDSKCKVIGLSYDLCADINWSDLLSKIKQHVNRVDVLVNNAGSLVNRSFAELPLDDARKVFEVNFFAVFGLTQTLLPIMGGAEQTHVVNIGSMGGVQGSAKFPGLSAYSASKGAVATLSECLAEELKEQNIKVNCLALGAVQTEMLEEAFPGYQAPLQANEMAAFIADFALNTGQYINGKVIPVSLSTP